MPKSTEIINFVVNTGINILGLDQEMLGWVEQKTGRVLFSGHGLKAIEQYEQRCAKNGTEPDPYIIALFIIEDSQQCYAVDNQGRVVSSRLESEEDLINAATIEPLITLRADFGDDTYCSYQLEFTPVY